MAGDEHRKIPAFIGAADPLDADVKWRALLDPTPVPLAVVGAADGAVVWTNAAMSALLGYTREELRHLPFLGYTNPDEGTDVSEDWTRTVRGEIPGYRREARVRHRDGHELWVIGHAAAVPERDGVVRHVLVQLVNITDQRGLVEDLRASEERWNLAVQISDLGFMLMRADGVIVEANDAALAMIGAVRTDLERGTFDVVTHADDKDASEEMYRVLRSGESDHAVQEKRYVHRITGKPIWVRLHLSVAREDDGSPRYYIGIIEDIRGRKSAEDELAFRATHDTLTGLPNRAMIESLLAEPVAEQKPIGVLSLDLDRFKAVNDSLGRDAGDELLRAVMRRLRAQLPADAVLARESGDQFLVLAPRAHDSAALRDIGERLQRALEEPLLVRGFAHTTNVSIGATISAPRHVHPDEVLRDADQALYRAKRDGRGRVEVYDPAQDKPATLDDLALEHALRRALQSGEGLVAHYQPIVRMADLSAVGYEALVRWQHPELGLLNPAAFLPLAEQTALIARVGDWMLETSCRAATDARLTDGWSRWVAVNASGSQLGRGELVPAVEHALDVSGLEPALLHLEITETALVEATPTVVKEINEIADMGVCIALDDFGTGFSSLTLLRDLPVGVVKIDRSFVAPIGIEKGTTAIVRSLIQLCGELGITTVAEGIETEDQLTALRALGCAEGQGFLFGHPAPLAERAAGGEP
ncbi:MAG TPA: EAL domain-containing protein [Mycobacteriales bacterium]|nr:EAL domain-containing protein [Mycobacteriales bacterium]